MIASRGALTHVNTVQDSLCIFESDPFAESLVQELETVIQQLEAIRKATSKMPRCTTLPDDTAIWISVMPTGELLSEK